MTQTSAGAPESRIIRVFLSSTFRDFMEERDLLVRQVFPELRRKARERGVEVVEVDLRWGITEEESRQGKVLPICLAEINRCRPYFVGMLGERYGWVPPDDEENRVVLTDQPWVAPHLGRRSVTELEILHGVLNNPEMAGRAFFYFRDPAWSHKQMEPGFVCDSDEEAQKLAELKQRILDSGFPLVKDLADPEALVNRIGADLWALIEEQFPEMDQPDALEREDRKHASYRRSRTELYEDGGAACVKVSQLEQWIAAGEQRILITGDSGAGKSALIANWMQQHQLKHPEDVVFAHHLGCSNDANALDAMLARMVQTASKLLAEELPEPIKIPQDYWELVTTVTDTLGRLSSWCKRHGRRWIWVLDGLDRLPEENQQALPWLPLQMFPHLYVVISALDCSVRKIIQERKYVTLMIGPLELEEQKALIKATMRHYNKTLVSELEAKILGHEPARSPLFLRVLLDELRVCGRHETLAQQLDDYLSAQSLDVLYVKVLKRIELDVGREAMQKVMTALWASRAGLCETELLSITELAPLQWLPIDLGLEGSLGRNGHRILFDHNYLARAVVHRYLPAEHEQLLAHKKLADWYQSKEGWNERDSEELLWQLQEAGRLEDLRDMLLIPGILANVQWDRGSREVINFWLAARGEDDGELDELISDDLEEEIDKRRGDLPDLIWFVDRIATLFDDAGFYREPLLKLRMLSAEMEQSAEDRDEVAMLSSLKWLADAHCDLGEYGAALPLYKCCLEGFERILGIDHPCTLQVISLLANLHRISGDYVQAETYYHDCLGVCIKSLGNDHPQSLQVIGGLAVLYLQMGDYGRAEAFFFRDLETSERLLGLEHPSTLAAAGNMGVLFRHKGDFEKSESLHKRELEAGERLLGADHPQTLKAINNLSALYRESGDLEKSHALRVRCQALLERLLGPEHPDTLTSVNNLAALLQDIGDLEQAGSLYKSCLEARERVLGPEHPDTLTTINNLASFFQANGDYKQAESLYNRCLEARERVLGPEHPDTLTTVNNLASFFQANGDYQQAESLFIRCLNSRERVLGVNNRYTNSTRYGLAGLLSEQGRYTESIRIRRVELQVAIMLEGQEAPEVLTSMHCLANNLFWNNELLEAKSLYQKVLDLRTSILGSDDASTMISRYCLAQALSAMGKHEAAIALRRIELSWCRNQKGSAHRDTLVSIRALALDLREVGLLEEAEALYSELLDFYRKAPDDESSIGVITSEFAQTLDQAGKLEAALHFARQALIQHYESEGPDAWWTNSARLDLANILTDLGRPEEALSQLNDLQQSIGRLSKPDEDDEELLADAIDLRCQIEAEY